MMEKYDDITPAGYTERMREMFYHEQTMVDFLEWIFDTQIDWMTQTEAWEQFEKEMQSSEQGSTSE